jgi:hypothetical protein
VYCLHLKVLTCRASRVFKHIAFWSVPNDSYIVLMSAHGSHVSSAHGLEAGNRIQQVLLSWTAAHSVLGKLVLARRMFQ